MFARRSLKSKKKLKERKRTVRFRSLSITVFMIVGIIFFAWVSHSQKITIKSIFINGNESLTKSEIENYITGKLSGNYLGIFSRANSFIYPKRSIHTGLLDMFPEIDTAEVGLNNLLSLIISIKEREPTYLWCVETKCYFMDYKGVIFAPAPYFSGSIYFEFYGSTSLDFTRDKSREVEPIGFYFLPTDIFSKIIDFKNRLENEIGITAQKLFTQENGDYEFILSNGVRILFNIEQNFNELIHNLDAALETKELNKNFILNNDAALDYIDLRFDNKVIYK